MDQVAETLAIDGGSPVRSSPFPPWPVVGPAEIEAVERVLRSGKVNYWSGAEGRSFEQEYAEFCGRRHAVAVANGSVALELALEAMALPAGAEVIVTPRSFIASASSVVLRGLKPVFADVDRASQNITAETIRPCISERTKAVIAVHLAGWPCDMDPIMELAAEHELMVIEDCAQAHGAEYKGRPVGSIGQAAAFSFCQDKIITTGGEGGMLLLNDAELWRRAWSYKDHGKCWDAVFNREHPPGFRWLHRSCGTNWRLTEMQSAIGRVLLRELPAAVARRRELAVRLESCLNPFPMVRTTPPPPDVRHAYYKYYFFVRPEQLAAGWSRDRIMAAVTAEGVPCFSGSCSEMYLEEAFGPELRPAVRLPAARELGETSLMLLVHPTLSDSDIDDACGALKKVLSRAGR